MIVFEHYGHFYQLGDDFVITPAGNGDVGSNEISAGGYEFVVSYRAPLHFLLENREDGVRITHYGNMSTGIEYLIPVVSTVKVWRYNAIARDLKVSIFDWRESLPYSVLNLPVGVWWAYNDLYLILSKDGSIRTKGGFTVRSGGDLRLDKDSWYSVTVPKEVLNKL